MPKSQDRPCKPVIIMKYSDLLKIEKNAWATKCVEYLW